MLSPYRLLQQVVYLALRKAWFVIPEKKLSPTTDLSRRIQVPLDHIHNVVLVSAVGAQMSRHLLPALGVTGEERVFRTRDFPALENKHSVFEQLLDKHHPLGLQVEQRLPDSRRCPALRNQPDRVIRFSFSRRFGGLPSLRQNT